MKPNLDIIHISRDRDFPDAGGGTCCMGAAVYGPGRCTCWEPVYDQEQAPPDLEAPPNLAKECCDDCAYRVDSPERSGAEGYQNNEAGDLEAMAASEKGIFYCHKGMRRIVKYRHPSGVEIDAHPAEYRPAQSGCQAFKADGSPADVCAGWLAEARKERHG